MPATDILNATPDWDEEISDSLTPDYDFPRNRTSTLARTKPPMGYESQRETSNDGHKFPLTWLGRTPEVVRILKRYFEQYEDGVFTIIDHDGGGRHYVGHFIGDWSETQHAHLNIDVQLTFQEVPGSTMVQYPADWDKDSAELFVLNDRGEQRMYASGTWAVTQHDGDPSFVTLDNDGARVDEWVQLQYRGYGFQVRALRTPEMGIWQVWLDGVHVGDLDAISTEDDGPSVVFTWEGVPLDIHRLKLVATNTTSGEGGKALNLLSVQVMR